jgi:hypothetical protein
MIGAGGLDDDAGWLLRGDPGDQFLMARPVIGKLLDTAFRVAMDVEMVFRDIDPDGDVGRGRC